MTILSSLKRWLKLGGIVALSVGSLVVAACTRSAGSDDPDGAPPQDAVSHRDAGVDGAARDAGTDARPNDGGPTDARLWDVLCE